MAVEMIIDHWNPNKRRYRTETFCYGPRACPLRPGAQGPRPSWNESHRGRLGGWRGNFTPRSRRVNTGCRLQRQNIQMRNLYHPLNSCGAQEIIIDVQETVAALLGRPIPEPEEKL